MKSRRSAVAMVGVVLLAFNLSRAQAETEVYSPQKFYGDITVETWSAPSGLTNTVTAGEGIFSNQVVRYKISALRDSKYVPVTGVSTATVGTTPSGIDISWTVYPGVDNMAIERSTNAGTNYYYRLIGSKSIHFLDAGATNNAGWVTTNTLTNAYSAIGTVSVPWTTTGERITETNRAIQAELALGVRITTETNRAIQADAVLATNGASMKGLTTNAFSSSWYSGTVVGIATGTYANGVLISVP